MDYGKYQKEADRQMGNIKSEMAGQTLRDLCKKRLQTSFIFSIAELEKVFGHLWGQQKEDDAELTTEEAVADDLFEKWRKRVLDLGNAQIRALYRDLDNYQIEFFKSNKGE